MCYRSSHTVKSSRCCITATINLIVLTAICFSLTAPAEGRWIDLGGGPAAVRILESDVERTLVEITVGGFEAIETQTVSGVGYQILLPNESSLEIDGLRALPTITRSLIIPDDKDVSVVVVSESHIDIPDMPVVLWSADRQSSGESRQAPRRLDQGGNATAVFPPDVVESRAPYIFRDFRGFALHANTFQSLVESGTLRVYTRMVIEITGEGDATVNPMERRAPMGALDRQFTHLYGDHFVNFEKGQYDQGLQNSEMLIIAHDDLAAAIEPLHNWRLQRGTPTTLVRLSEILCPPTPDTTAIREYIASAYDTGGISSVLLVGSYELLPSCRAAAFQHGSTPYEWGVSDVKYGLIEGNDSYPEVFVGRFSADTPAHVDTQVERSIHYERDIQAGDEWLARAAGVGMYGTEKTMADVRDRLLACGYTEVDEIYQVNGGTREDLTLALNGGRGMVNAMHHGCPTHVWMWDSIHLYTRDHINALENDYRLPLLFWPSCSISAINEGEVTLAETCLRATHEGAPTGALAVFALTRRAGTDAVGWAIKGAVALLQEHQEEAVSVGSLWYGGGCQMVDMSPMGDHVMKTLMLLGDPSMLVRTGIPQSMSLSHAGSIPLGYGAYIVEVPDVSSAECALYADGVLYGSTWTDASGAAVVVMDTPPGEEMVLTLTVSAPNRITAVEDVNVAAGSVCEVLPDGTGDYPTIQAAIDAAEPGWIIDLSAGIFSGEGNRDLDFLGKAIMIRGSGASLTTIDCGGSEVKNHRGFTLVSGEGPNTVLRDVEIINGYWRADPGGEGGGALRCSQASPTVVGCRFAWNTHENCWGGGAVMCTDSSPRFLDCEFSNNTSNNCGGAITLLRSDAVIRNCEFSNNAGGSFGGAVYCCENCEVDLTGCSFTTNSADSRGGAVAYHLACNLDISDCSFASNDVTLGDGGAVYCCLPSDELEWIACGERGSGYFGGTAIVNEGLRSGSQANLSVVGCQFLGNEALSGKGGALSVVGIAGIEARNCVFAENGAHLGGAVSCELCTSPEISNCLIAMNSSSAEGGGVRFGECSMVRLIRSTIHGNSAGRGGVIEASGSGVYMEGIIVSGSIGGCGVCCDGAGEAMLWCCDVWDNQGGDWIGCIDGQLGIEGNFCSDPLFCSEENPEYPQTLHDNSPCAPRYVPGEPFCGRIGAHGVGCGWQTGIGRPDGGAPRDIRLEAGRPSPSSGEVEISFALPTWAAGLPLKLELFDITGRQVARLAEGKREAGFHVVSWDGTSGSGDRREAGTYFARLEVGDDHVVRRIVLIR